MKEEDALTLMLEAIHARSPEAVFPDLRRVLAQELHRLYFDMGVKTMEEGDV